MKPLGSSFSLKEQIDTLIAAAAGVLFIYLYTLHSGIGLSPDTITYLTSARNLQDHGALTDFNGFPVVDFPAGYPAFLGMVSWITGLEPLRYAPVLNEGLFALTILICGWMMSKFIHPSRWYKRILLVCIVLSPCFLEVFAMLWSESLFIPLELLFFLALHHYLKTHRISSLAWMILLAALAGDTRYIGFTLIVAGSLLMLAQQRRSWLVKLIHTGVFSLGGISILAWNLVRNYHIMGVLTGQREKALNSLGTNLYFFGTTLQNWLLPWDGSRIATILLAIGVIGGLSFFLVKQLSRRLDSGSYELILLTFFVVYVLVILAISTISRFEDMDSRLLSPVFIPLYLASSFWIVPFIRNSGGRFKRILTLGLALIAFLLVFGNELGQDFENYDGIKDAGMPGYMEDSWQQSATIQYLKQHRSLFRDGYPIYSDADDAVYFFTGLHAQILPHKDSKSDMQDILSEPHYYLVWFDDGYDPDLVSLHTLFALQPPVCVARFYDGAIYLYQRKSQ